jgi:hypothetical protein
MSFIDRLRSWLFGSDRTGTAGATEDANATERTADATEDANATKQNTSADESDPQLDPDKTTEVRTERSLSGVDTLNQMRDADDASERNE